MRLSHPALGDPEGGPLRWRGNGVCCSLLHGNSPTAADTQTEPLSAYLPDSQDPMRLNAAQLSLCVCVCDGLGKHRNLEVSVCGFVCVVGG